MVRADWIGIGLVLGVAAYWLNELMNLGGLL